MNSLRHFLALIILSLVGSHSVLGAEDKLLEGETLGKLALGDKAEQLTKVIGKPSGKGKDEHWEATGEWVQEWSFPAHGLKLNMASEKKGGAKLLSSITATAPCKLATSRGITLGSTEAAVRKAYADVQDKEQSVPGETFVAGSIYGGAIFSLKDGKVVRIFIGAAAE